MDKGDLKRLSAKAKEQGSNIERAFKQLAEDVALRHRVNDSSMQEVKEQVEQLNKICLENQELTRKNDEITNTNSRDIEILKDQIGILKNCIVDLQKRNQFLEDLNASLINQLKNLVDGLSTSAIEEQNVMREVISEIMAKVCSRPSGFRGRRSGRSSPNDAAGSKRLHRKSESELPVKTSALSSENLQKSGDCQTGDETEPSGSASHSTKTNKTVFKEKEFEKGNVKNTVAISEESTSENGDATTGKGKNEPLIYHVTEKHGDTGSKALRINFAPIEEDPDFGASLRKSSFSTSFNSLANNPASKGKKKSSVQNACRTTSLQSLDVLESLDENDWPDTDKIIGELQSIKKYQKNSPNQEESCSKVDNSLTTVKCQLQNSVDLSKDCTNDCQLEKCDELPHKEIDTNNTELVNIESNNIDDSKTNCSSAKSESSESVTCAIQVESSTNGHIIHNFDHQSTNSNGLSNSSLGAMALESKSTCLDNAENLSKSLVDSSCSSENQTSDHSSDVIDHLAKNLEPSATVVPDNKTPKSKRSKGNKNKQKQLAAKKKSVPEGNNSKQNTHNDCDKSGFSDLNVNDLTKDPAPKIEAQSCNDELNCVETVDRNVNSKSPTIANCSYKSPQELPNTKPENFQEKPTRRETNSSVSLSEIVEPVNSELYSNTSNENNKPEIESVETSSLTTESASEKSDIDDEKPGPVTITKSPEAVSDLKITRCDKKISKSDTETVLTNHISSSQKRNTRKNRIKEKKEADLVSVGGDKNEIRVASEKPESSVPNKDSDLDVERISINKGCKSNARVDKENSDESQFLLKSDEKDFSQNSVKEGETKAEVKLSNESITSSKKVLDSSSQIDDATVSESEIGVQSKSSEDSKNRCVQEKSEVAKRTEITADKSSSVILSPEAKEFEPTREYGKAKLQLSPEVSKESKFQARCPKLTSFRMENSGNPAKDESTQEKLVKGSCVQCSSPTTQRCANCRQVFYCKRECQREHWRAGHKNDCKPFKIEKDFIMGRCLVATRDFKAGDVIFKDEPLLIGPKQVTEPVCLGCYKRVDGSYRCRKCTWPLCGPACENAPDHQPECVVGKEIGSPIDIQDFNEANHFYEVVSTLRALTLKKRSPKKYEDLLSLVSHCEERKGTDVYNTNQKRVVNMLRNYFMLIDFPTDDIDASEASIHRMTGIIDCNSVDIPLAETEIEGIYPTFSLLEHSCTPNTKHKFSSSKTLTLKAAVDIRQGEHLTTIYSQMIWGTAARRDFIKKTRFFLCTCRRCADPTELGTNFSAIRCQKCPNGFLMSGAPLDEQAMWICTTCSAIVSSEEALEINQSLGDEVEKVLISGNVDEYEKFIERVSSTQVHPNHYHLFPVKHSLLQMLGRDKTGLDDETVKKKEKLCQEFLKTCTALDPGMSKLGSYAGIALYEYHLAVLARARRGPSEQQVDKAALKKDLDTAKALLQQCIKVLQDEPDEKPETQLRGLAQENLIELNQWASL